MHLYNHTLIHIITIQLLITQYYIILLNIYFLYLQKNSTKLNLFKVISSFNLLPLTQLLSQLLTP